MTIIENLKEKKEIAVAQKKDKKVITVIRLSKKA